MLRWREGSRDGLARAFDPIKTDSVVTLLVCWVAGPFIYSGAERRTWTIMAELRGHRICFVFVSFLVLVA